MKRVSIALIAISMYFATTHAVKAQQFEPGSITFSAGYGFPSLTKTLFHLVDGDNISSTFVGPFYAKVEFAMNETVGFGVNAAYSYGDAVYQRVDAANDSITYTTGVTLSSYSILARANFHFGNSDRFDPYAGIGMGYRNSKYTYTGNDPEVNPSDLNGFNHFGLDFTLGARVYITDNIGIYGEVGIAKTPIQVGLVARF